MPLKALSCAFVAAAVSVGGFLAPGHADAAARHVYHSKTGHHAKSGHHARAGQQARTSQHATRSIRAKEGVAGKRQRQAARTSKGHHAMRAGALSGMASWYAYGSRTASGARFNPNGMTAAHRTLPFGTRVLVRSRATGRTVQVTINDRGPFVGGRVIDLARGAATQLGIVGSGVGHVELTVVR